MKLEIWNDDTPEPEKVVRLRLVSSDCAIALVAVDASGNMTPGGNILQITDDGEIHRYPSVGSDLGFSLDDFRRVKTN